MGAKKAKYQKSFESLEKIYADLREGKIGIDDLEESLKKALAHIQTCKEILKKQENKASDLMKEIEQEIR
ncbi:MAG: exodeoxyribonuclease VII small subunit [Candidatus Margulisbacteria bacterium]|nr:exodeoxyribonuclease VII small subunit [Candidatus Margulisiibacteriota bacterium]MBU1617209.1 exodeoxyribonuclease VII small subunit [Candidatus Margulisiibacteriota bacterium]